MDHPLRLAIGIDAIDGIHVPLFGIHIWQPGREIDSSGAIEAEIVRRTKRMSVEFVDEHLNLASLHVGSRHTSGVPFAGHEPALLVKQEPIRSAGIFAKDAQLPT